MGSMINDNVAEVATNVSVRSGDRVMVALVDGEPCVIGFAGGGDRTADLIDETGNRISSVKEAVEENARLVEAAGQGAHDAAAIANAALTAAGATANHFWMDDAGQANVTTDDRTVATGHSVTIGAKGIIQRMAGKVLQSLTRTALNFYTDSTEGPRLAASYTPEGMGVFASGKQVSSMTGSGTLFYDGSGSIAEENVIASFGARGAQIGKAADVHSVTSEAGFTLMSGNSKAAGFGFIDTIHFAEILTDSLAAGASYTLKHTPYAGRSIFLLASTEDGTTQLLSGIDYTLSGRTITLTTSETVTAAAGSQLRIHYYYLSTEPKLSLLNDNVVLTHSALNEPSFICTDGTGPAGTFEWVFTNQKNIRVRNGDGDWDYFSKVGHKHKLSGIKAGSIYKTLWKQRELSRSYSIKANSYTTVSFDRSADKPDDGYGYAAISRIFTQHQAVVSVSGWNVTHDQITVAITNFGNNSAIDTSTLYIKALELKD